MTKQKKTNKDRLIQLVEELMIDDPYEWRGFPWAARPHDFLCRVGRLQGDDQQPDLQAAIRQKAEDGRDRPDRRQRRKADFQPIRLSYGSEKPSEGRSRRSKARDDKALEQGGGKEGNLS